MITFASVLRGPDEGFLYRSADYKPEHVLRLYGQIREHYPEPFRFVCLTNMAVPEVENIPLEEEWPGFFAKLELFRHDLGHVVYMDLDLTVKGDISWMGTMHKGTGLWALDDFLWPRMNSSIMSWVGPWPELTEGFEGDEWRHWMTMPDRWSDQAWLYNKLDGNYRSIQDAYPGEIRGYKTDGDGDCSVLVYHGRPKPWDLEK